MMKVDWKWPRWLESHLKNLPGWLDNIAQRAVKAVGDEFLKEARRNLTKEGGLGIRVREGKLIRALRMRLDREGKSYQAILVFPFIGKMLEEGGIIRPKNGRKYLVFRLFKDTDTTERTGPWVSVKEVRIKPFRWASKAREKAVKRMPVFLAQALREGMK